jgi:hypothetical protein
VKSIIEFFRDYKVPDGKPQNKFAFGAKPKDKYFAVDVIQESHQHWRSLFSGFVSHQHNINL